MISSRYQRNTFGTTILSKANGTAPAAASGTAVTPAQNAYGNYATLITGANLTVDCCEITIVVNSVGISGTARDGIVSIGIDPAGGTTYTAIPGMDLLVGPAGAYAGSMGVAFRFRLFIKAGTSIGAAAAVNSATLTAVNVFAVVRGRPSHPQNIYVGSYVDSFGVTLASSSGTAVTSGTAADGTLVQLGSALTRPCYEWEFGMGINSAAINSNTIEVDIATGTSGNPNVVISNHPVLSNTSEAINKFWARSEGPGAAGDVVLARCQTGNNAANTGITIAAYGVGG